MDKQEGKAVTAFLMELADLIERQLALYEYVAETLIPERKTNDKSTDNPKPGGE